MQRILLSTRTMILILLLLPLTAAVAQERVITGKITGPDQAGIPGVSIYQKGTSTGTISDADGNYTLTLVNAESVLVFSSIGYATQEISVDDRSVVSIVMKEDSRTLDEVVIVGYGEQRRSDVTGALSVVKVEDMQNKTALRLDQALQGMASGVNVTRNGGAPGAAPTIHIRGVGSIGNTEPLWIIDGVRMEPGNNFDVNDVESMEVLKDAAASAVYGAQAAHGVILVRTKRGKGDFKVTFKSSIGQRQPVKFPKFLNSADFVKYKKQARQNAGQNPDPLWDNYTADTDWLNLFYNGSGIVQSNYVSISKGDEKFNYYMSLGNDNEQGILIDNSYKRYSLRINTDMKLTQWMKLGESLLLSRVNENPIGNNDESTTGAIPYRSNPTMPLYDPTNTYGGWGRGQAYFGGPNPVATQYQQHDTRISNRIDGNLYLELTPVKGLMVRSAVGLNSYGYQSQAFNEAFDYGAFVNHVAQLTYGATNSSTYTANLVATYSKKFGKHDFKLMGGYEAWQYDGRHFNVIGYGFPVANSSSINLTTGTLTSTDRANVNQARLLSQFGRFNYSFDDRFLIEANVRRDGSSKFGPSNLWGVFPSVSAGWNISQEKFFAGVKYISGLKVRASIGKLGSNSIGDFIYLNTYTNQFSTYSFDEKGANKVPGFYSSRLANPDVRWEEVNMSNIAVDLHAFENKVSLSVDYYIKDTKGLLYGVPIPASIGVSTNNFDAVNPQVNIGTMRNTGIDIDLGYTTQVQKWKVGAIGNVSFMKNKMLSLLGDQYITSGDAGLQIGGITRTYPGKPISSFYGYRVQQMLNSANDVYAVNTYSKDGIYQEAGTGPGDLMYKDLGGPANKPDGKITPLYDRTVIGNPWPKMTYGLNLSATYDNLIDISLQFQGIAGVDIFNANKAYSHNFFGDDNTTTAIYDAWTPEHHTQNPRNISGDPNYNFSKPSTYFIESGSYLKLRNVQIGLNVPNEWLKKVNLKKARIYVNGNNLLTITKYSGLDPEIAGSNLSRGIDYGMYPQVRTLSAGFEVQF